MSETPKKIWLADYELRDAATWEWDEGIPYIRADIVDELVAALEEAIDGMGGSYAVWSVKAKAALKKLEESHDR